MNNNISLMNNSISLKIIFIKEIPYVLLSKTIKILALFVRLFLLINMFFLIGGVNLYGALPVGFGNKEKKSFNPVFEDYFNRLARVELELLALEPSPEIEKKSDGELDLFFELYQKTLEDIEMSVKEHNVKELSELEKQSLQVYAQLIMANQVHTSYYTVLKFQGENKSKERKKMAIESQNLIIDMFKENKIPSYRSLNKSFDDEVYSRMLKSFLLSLYAENFFFSINFRKFKTFSFGHEAHTLFKESLWYNPHNLRAMLGYGNFYTAAVEASPLYAGISSKKQDTVLEELSNKVDSPYDRSLVFLTYINKSQIAITKRNYSGAEKYIAAAGNLFPKSGYLNYIRSLLKKRRTLFNGGESVWPLKGDNSQNKPLNFYYSYSIELKNFFLYKNYFNFIAHDTIWTLFLNAGNSFYPASLLAEEGLMIGFNQWSLELGIKQNPLFTKGIGSYTGFLGIKVKPKNFFLHFRTDYGLFYDYMPSKTDFSLQNHEAISASLSWSASLYHSYWMRLSLQHSLEYRYSFGKDAYTLETDIKVPWTIIDHGWGELYTINGVDFAYSSSPSSIRKRAEFFERTPNSLGKFKTRIDYYENQLSGVLLFYHTLSYRFYPLMFLDDYTPAKGLFIAPSFYYGVAVHNIKNLDDNRSDTVSGGYSILGNIGYRFPGDMTISAGAGWNNQEGLVINVLMH